MFQISWVRTGERAGRRSRAHSDWKLSTVKSQERAAQHHQQQAIEEDQARGDTDASGNFMVLGSVVERIA